MVGANATQGIAILLFLMAFALLGGAMAADGSLLLFALFLVCAGVSVALFLKAKPWEHKHETMGTHGTVGAAKREIGTAKH